MTTVKLGIDDIDDRQEVEDRNGNFIGTFTGKRFWPFDPRPEDVDILDIAHALSNTCRYSGHSTYFYSVAQHSVLVSENVPQEHALWGLLHDAAEAYISDIPRPIKPYLTGYSKIETEVERVIAEHFELPYPIPDEVKQVDNSILFDEAPVLMGPSFRWWNKFAEPLGIIVVPWTAEESRERFLDKYTELVLND